MLPGDDHPQHDDEREGAQRDGNYRPPRQELLLGIAGAAGIAGAGRFGEGVIGCVRIAVRLGLLRLIRGGDRRGSGRLVQRAVP